MRFLKAIGAGLVSMTVLCAGAISYLSCMGSGCARYTPIEEAHASEPVQHAVALDHEEEGLTGRIRYSLDPFRVEYGGQVYDPVRSKQIEIDTHRWVEDGSVTQGYETRHRACRRDLYFNIARLRGEVVRSMIDVVDDDCELHSLLLEFEEGFRVHVVHPDGLTLVYEER